MAVTIKLTFNNPLNTSVQIGDTAYFSNPYPVGGVGSPTGGQWASTVTPHLTNDISEVISLGEIIDVIQWNGAESYIVCDMDQAIFNKYWGDFTLGGCVSTALTSGLASSPNCASKTFVPYSELLANSSGFVDRVGVLNPTTLGPGYRGPSLYRAVESFPTISGDAPFVSREFGVMILHWFWDHPNGQNLTFSDYAFEHWSGDVWYIDRYPWNLTSFQPVTPYFNNVTEIISFWQSELALYESTTYSTPNPNPLGSPSWRTNSEYYPRSTITQYNSGFSGSSGVANNIAIVPGCSFDAYYNRFFGSLELSYAFCLASWCAADVYQCTGLSTDCTNGSYIMFTKDNKVNTSSLLGYYASVEFKNSSREKAELFNVGTSFFESSK